MAGLATCWTELLKKSNLSGETLGDEFDDKADVGTPCESISHPYMEFV